MSGGGGEPKSTQCTIVCVSTSSDLLGIAASSSLVLNFSKDIDQAHFLCRWRPLQCATSFPQSSLRTRRTDYLLCQAYNQVNKGPMISVSNILRKV